MLTPMLQPRNLLRGLGLLVWPLALTVALPDSARASVIRCQGPDGRISYQDKSCPDGSPGLPVDATPNQGFQFATKEEIERAKRLEQEERLAPPPKPPKAAKTKVRHGLNAGERKFVSRGDHVDAVRRRIGGPDRVVHSSVSSSHNHKDSRQQWIYEPAPDDPQTTTILTINRGLVLHVERKVTY
jgi:hypothetical protein